MRKKSFTVNPKQDRYFDRRRKYKSEKGNEKRNEKRNEKGNVPPLEKGVKNNYY